MKKYIGTKIIKAEPEMEEGVEGYKVVYEDGYVSWSPKDVFEKAYRECDNMTFGLAIEALKKGKKVARKGWNGKGMYLFLVEGKELYNPIKYNHEDVDINKFPPVDVIAMKTVNSVQVGWLASQTDMLAEDWIVVE